MDERAHEKQADETAASPPPTLNNVEGDYIIGGMEPTIAVPLGTSEIAKLGAIAANIIGIDEFIRSIVDLGLLSASEASSIGAKHTASQDSASSQLIARELVTSGRLTGYQAGAICQGKARGLVIGRYIVLDKLGAGGMGMVFKAQHRKLKQVVALKILPPSVTSNAELVQRFHREAEATAKLNHPNIVRAIDADEAGGMHFLVMDYVDGVNLSKLVKARGVLTIAKAIDILIAVGQGLAVAHSEGIVHRDIKPSNLMIDTRGMVKILDLGLARLSDSNAPDDGALTLSGAMVGTVDYMSPEQAFDPRLADARSDIYSLGCTLHYLLTATAVYGGSSLMQRLLAHREKPIPSLRKARPDVPPALDTLFQKMLAKDPANRPSSMTDVVEALEGCKSSAAMPKGKNTKPLMVFDLKRNEKTPPPLAILDDRSESRVDPTPLPRLTHPLDAINPDSRSGLRLEDKRKNVHLICDADAVGFRRWAEFVRASEAIPTSVSVFDGGQRPAFAAIALPNRGQIVWDVMLHADIDQYQIYAKTMESRGRKLSHFSGYQIASRHGILCQFRNTADTIDHTINIDHKALVPALEKIEKALHRVIYLAGYSTASGRRFAVVSSRTSIRPQRLAYELTLDALRAFTSRAQDEGYSPISLTSSSHGETSCFSIILEKVPDRVVEMSFGLTQNELESEFHRRITRGFLPIVFCGFNHEKSVLYHMGWLQGRLPKGI